MSTKVEGDENLQKGSDDDGYNRGRSRRTYLSSGIKVSDQMMADMPPITSSLDGTGSPAGQIPFSTYRGDVPMSEYMIPKVGSEPRKEARGAISAHLAWRTPAREAGSHAPSRRRARG